MIVGDLPSAYIAALDGYIYEMTKWVDAVKKDEDVSELIPVDVPPTMEWASEL